MRKKHDQRQKRISLAPCRQKCRKSGAPDRLKCHITADIQRQKRQVEQIKKLETKKIPKDIDYDDVYSLRLEAKQKLKEYEPTSIGQASRISGVSPADISVLLVYLESHRG